MTSTRSNILAGAAALAVALLAQSRIAETVISDPARLDAAVRRCMTDSSGRASPLTDAEPYAATNPRDPRHIVAAWQMLGGPNGVIQASASFDGGATWTPPRALPFSACANGPREARRASDPWVAFGPDGRVYVAGIGWHEGDGADGYNALVVTSSADGGRSWGPGVVASLSASADGVTQDNVSIAADPRRPGTVYLATTRYSPVRDSTGATRAVGPIGFTRSTDHGRTWSPMSVVGTPVPRGRVSAPQLHVDPSDGRLMVFYYRSEPGRALVGWQTSRDGGATWEPERQIAPAVDARWQLENVGGRSRFILAGDILQAALDPARGAIHVAYPDGRRDPGGRLGVSLVSSFDRGATWTAPVSVSPDGPLTAWLPAIAPTGDGGVAVAWLSADFSAREAARIDYHVRSFSRGGASMRAGPAAVLARTAVSWPGDYHALVATPAGARLVTVRADAASARANPTDVVILGPTTSSR